MFVALGTKIGGEKRQTCTRADKQTFPSFIVGNNSEPLELKNEAINHTGHHLCLVACRHDGQNKNCKLCKLHSVRWAWNFFDKFIVIWWFYSTVHLFFFSNNTSSLIQCNEFGNQRQVSTFSSSGVKLQFVM